MITMQYGNKSTDSALITKGIWNKTPIYGTDKRYDLGRALFSAEATFDISWYKECFDAAISRNGLIIFGAHDYYTFESDGTLANAKNILTYMKDNGCKFMKVADAMAEIEKFTAQKIVDSLC